MKADGSRFECKDCHQGKAKFLPAPDGSTSPTSEFTELVKRMKGYKTGLGVKCGYCHNTSDYKKSSPKKDLAHKMMDFVNTYEVEDGKGGVAPLECNYCHNGKAKFLPTN